MNNENEQNDVELVELRLIIRSDDLPEITKILEENGIVVSSEFLNSIDKEEMQ